MSNESIDDVKATIIDLDPDQVVDANDTERATAPAIKPRRSRGVVLLSGVALLAAALAGGWLYRDVLSGYFPTNQLAEATARGEKLEAENKTLRDDVARLDTLTKNLSSSVNALESKISESAASVGTAVATADDNKARVAALEAQLTETKLALADMSSKLVAGSSASAGTIDGTAMAAMVARLGALEKDVASLKSTQMSGTADTAVLSQSLADLKAKIASGIGYAAELERVQRLAPAAPGLDVLALSSTQGIASAKGLGDELATLAATLPKPAAATEDESGSLLASAWKAVSGMVRVRNLGDVDWQAAATSAAALATQGDLRPAIDQLSALEGAKPAALSQWIERAQARLKLEAATEAVSDAVVRVIAARG